MMKNTDKIVERFLNSETLPARREAEMEQGIAAARRMSTELSGSKPSNEDSD